MPCCRPRKPPEPAQPLPAKPKTLLKQLQGLEHSSNTFKDLDNIMGRPRMPTFGLAESFHRPHAVGAPPKEGRLRYVAQGVHDVRVLVDLELESLAREAKGL